MKLNEASLEKKFDAVSTSQGSIQTLSFFCLHYKDHHERIAKIWLKCLKKARISHRLTLIYLANDIVQNAKRKNTPAFIDDFKVILKDTVPHLRDEKIKKAVERVFSIWQDRKIYDAKFLNDLKQGLNSSKAPKTTIEPVTPPLPAEATKELNDRVVTKPSEGILEVLNRLNDIEKNIEKLRTADDGLVEQLNHGNFTNTNDTKSLETIKNYIISLKREVDERNHLTKLLENSMAMQKKLLKESEDQLVTYKAKLDHISKLRDDIC